MLINVNWGGVKWKPFKLIDLFEFTKGNQNNMATLIPGDIPLVSARKCDNGYKGFIYPNGKSLFNGDMITLNLDGDGGAGIAFYQPTTMALDSHVGALRPKIPMTRYQQIFIAMCLTNQGDMFGHGYSINGNRIRSLKIMLPVTSDSEIAWGLMDQYMRNIESAQIYEYLTHIHARSSSISS